MLLALFVVLLLPWGLGMLTAYTLGGFIHVLMILALISVVWHLLSRRGVA